MTHRQKRNQRSRQNYQKLEARQLLASVVFGTAGDDLISVSYVDETTVDIQVNDSLMSDVDVSDGLLVNLLDGNADSAIIDHRITANVTVVHAETLQLTGGVNHWQVSAMEASAGSSDSVVVGVVNSNLRFAWVDSIHGGADQDTFTVNTGRDYALNVHGGEGDDSFWFMAADSSEAATSSVVAPHVTGYGEGGSDRFSYFGESNDRGFGGAGFDIVDYRKSSIRQDVWLNQSADGSFENERVFANPALDNSASVALVGADLSLNWYVIGDWTIVKESGSETALELMNFSAFKSEVTASTTDIFYVLATSREIDIHDAEKIKIGSKIAPEFATLDTIQHDIGIHRSLGDFSTSASSSAYSSRSPEVVISDQGGDGFNAWAKPDGSLIGLGAGRIHFGNAELDSVFASFQPQITIHGSDSSNDTLVLEKTWTPIEIHGHGGDDTVMIGGVNGTAGNLDAINGNVVAIGGEGTDRVYFNDQGNEARSTKYFVSDEVVKDQSAQHRFSDVTFGDQLEVIRVNGSHSEKNNFTVAPSEATKLVVDGTAQNSESDILRILHPDSGIRLVNSDGTGSWYFGDNTENVYFYGLEDPNNPLALAGNSISHQTLPVRSSIYNDLSNRVITSQSEFDSFVASLDVSNPFSGAVELSNALKAMTIDFAESNFVLYTQTETSGSIRVELGTPRVSGDQGYISIERTLPPLGTADMAYYGHGYVVSKTLTGITFDLGDSEIYLEFE